MLTANGYNPAEPDSAVHDSDGENKLYEIINSDYNVSKCAHCREYTFWYKKKIVFPRKTAVGYPNDDLSNAVKELYSEAALILSDSPRAAAALLRLALQKLLIELGGEGSKSINDNVGDFVKAGKIDSTVKKAMDSLRIIGNTSVHPGEIDLSAKPEKVEKLFWLINYIADQMITGPKELNEMFDDLPVKAKEAVKRRDRG
ncbi:DUF4145 domain-containing protein [Candidatus Saccharibacteria bacterium]|nr:DUF4145 domain-containing protein [Candidatus Saccharibacteria bacterium]